MKKVFFDLGPGVPNSEAWDQRWKEYTIIGLEPDIERYNILKPIFPGILLNVAVADKEGILIGSKHLTSGFINGGYPDLKTDVEVKCTTLDSLDKEYGLFDEVAIWADIEGSELLMLKGATEVLKKTNWINVELHTQPVTEHWVKQEQVFEFLEQLCFKPEHGVWINNKDTFYDVVFTKKCLENVNGVSIVTPVFCPSDTVYQTIVKCFESIKKAIDKVNGEWIIVDDCSLVGSDFFKDISTKYIKNDINQGTAFSLNRGFEIAKGKLVVKVDADYLVPENLFEILLEDWDDTLAFLAPSFCIGDPNSALDLEVSNIETADGGVYDKPTGLNYVNTKYFWGGGVIMFDLNKIKEVNYFDEDYGLGGGEDNDIIYRLLMKGYNWRWTDRIIVKHFASIVSKDPNCQVNREENRRLAYENFMRKHGFAAGDCISKPAIHFNYKDVNIKIK